MNFTLALDFRVLTLPDPEQSCDPLGLYAETFWLPKLYPAAYLIGRRLVATHLRHQANGLAGHHMLNASTLAAALGLVGATSGSMGTFWRGMERLIGHHLVRLRGEANLEVRMRWPRLSSRALLELPLTMQRDEPDYWAAEPQAPSLAPF